MNLIDGLTAGTPEAFAQLGKVLVIVGHIKEPSDLLAVNSIDRCNGYSVVEIRIKSPFGEAPAFSPLNQPYLLPDSTGLSTDPLAAATTFAKTVYVLAKQGQLIELEKARASIQAEIDRVRAL